MVEEDTASSTAQNDEGETTEDESSGRTARAGSFAAKFSGCIALLAGRKVAPGGPDELSDDEEDEPKSPPQPEAPEEVPEQAEEALGG